MHKWRILLDLDGTVLENAGRTVAARHFGITLAEETDQPSLLQLLGLTKEGFWAWWHENQDEIYARAVPLHGASTLLKQLRSSGSYIAVVTARRGAAEPVTTRWLADHGFEYDQIRLDADDKLAIAKELQLNLVFEDDAANALALADLCPVVLIRGRKNDAQLDHPNIYRIDRWDEVSALLHRLGSISA
jgi:uncharacterized HAD superfamily protein